jgi:D-xylose transport system permease protein
MKTGNRTWRGLLILAGLAILLHFLTQGTFTEPRNLTNLARQVAINGILAVGMTYIILIGGIDLSVGSVVALCGIAAGVLQVKQGWSEWSGAQAWIGAFVSLMASVVVGILAGWFNGFMITRYRIAPFIITLGMMVIARGAALIFSDGAAISPTGDAFNEIGQGYLPVHATLIVLGLAAAMMVMMGLRAPGEWRQKVGGVGIGILLVAGAGYVFGNYNGLPYPVLVFVLLALAGTFVLERTRAGRFTLALGGNAEAAWLAGVPIRRITVGIYTLMGALSGLSGAILTARLNGALPTAGELFELDAIAAVVIGGTSLQGGSGTIQGSVLGAFLIGTLNNGMSLMAIPEFYQKVIKGVIIVLAVWLDTRQKSATSRATAA